MRILQTSTILGFMAMVFLLELRYKDFSNYQLDAWLFAALFASSVLVQWLLPLWAAGKSYILPKYYWISFILFQVLCCLLAAARFMDSQTVYMPDLFLGMCLGALLFFGVLIGRFLNDNGFVSRWDSLPENAPLGYELASHLNSAELIQYRSLASQAEESRRNAFRLFLFLSLWIVPPALWVAATGLFTERMEYILSGVGVFLFWILMPRLVLHFDKRPPNNLRITPDHLTWNKEQFAVKTILRLEWRVSRSMIRPYAGAPMTPIVYMPRFYNLYVVFKDRPALLLTSFQERGKRRLQDWLALANQVMGIRERPLLDIRHDDRSRVFFRMEAMQHRGASVKNALLAFLSREDLLFVESRDRGWKSESRLNFRFSEYEFYLQLTDDACAFIAIDAATPEWILQTILDLALPAFHPFALFALEKGPFAESVDYRAVVIESNARVNVRDFPNLDSALSYCRDVLREIDSPSPPAVGLFDRSFTSINLVSAK